MLERPFVPRPQGQPALVVHRRATRTAATTESSCLYQAPDQSTAPSPARAATLIESDPHDQRQVLAARPAGLEGRPRSRAAHPDRQLDRVRAADLRRGRGLATAPALQLRRGHLRRAAPCSTRACTDAVNNAARGHHSRAAETSEHRRGNAPTRRARPPTTDHDAHDRPRHATLEHAAARQRDRRASSSRRRRPVRRRRRPGAQNGDLDGSAGSEQQATRPGARTLADTATPRARRRQHRPRRRPRRPAPGRARPAVAHARLQPAVAAGIVAGPPGLLLSAVVLITRSPGPASAGPCPESADSDREEANACGRFQGIDLGKYKLGWHDTEQTTSTRPRRA